MLGLRRKVRFVPRADVTLLNRLRSTAIDLRDNFARPRSRVTVQPLSLSGAGLNAEGLDCQIAETVCCRPRRSGRANVKASIGGCLCLRTLIRIPTRGLGFLVSLVTCRMQRSVQASLRTARAPRFSDRQRPRAWTNW